VTSVDCSERFTTVLQLSESCTTLDLDGNPTHVEVSFSQIHHVD
jgi:hypothetical protein